MNDTNITLSIQPFATPNATLSFPEGERIAIHLQRADGEAAVTIVYSPLTGRVVMGGLGGVAYSGVPE